jgi:NAD(P)-dependent dehydrogenase (short-subunit alcohol dehydrogenase family)
MRRVKGKVAIVTGVALGIGRATAVLLAEEGATVAITDLRDKEGKDLAERINGEGDAAGYWHLDVAREKEVRHVFEKIHERFGRIDILVNNAGIAGATKPTHEITEEEWDHVQAVNVKGVFFCTKHAIPFLRRAGGGSIINLSSIYGLIGAPDVPPNRSTVMTGSRPTR